MTNQQQLPVSQQASQFLNRIVVELFNRTTLPPDQRPPRIGALHVLEDACDIEQVLNDPGTFEKDFALVTAVGPSRFNMNGAEWTNIRAKTQRYYAKAGRPSSATVYHDIYQDELANLTDLSAKGIEDAILRAALRCFFAALEISCDPNLFLPHFHDLRRMVELLQYRSWVSAADETDELQQIGAELSAIRQRIWHTCQGNAAIMDLLNRFATTGDAFPLETVFSDFMTNLFAGIETTTASLSWMIDCLSRGIAVQDALRQDIVDGDDTRLDGFRNECLRLFSPIPFVVRRVAAPTRLSVGHLPAGALVMVSLVGLHRDPKYWKEPHVFHAARTAFSKPGQLPERSFRPFLSGPRACGGRRIADMELQVGLRLILQHFALRNDGAESAFRYSLAFRPVLTKDLSITRISPVPSA